MRNEVLALAHVAGLASGTPSRRKNSRHGRFAAVGSCLVPGRFSGEHRSDGLQRHIAPERSLIRSAVARNPRHFTGGPSRAFGWAAVERGIAPVTAKYGCRVLGSVAAASRWLASRLGLALARAASDNRSIHTDTQVHRAAQRRLFMGAGDFRR